MCGIAGILSNKPRQGKEIESMVHAISHRGPDGSSSWSNPPGTVTFGHCRLSIIDLTPRGSQAMHYMGRYTIVYNGEIYNYLEIRENLQSHGYTFNSNSDTEVILAAYDHFKKKCLDHFDGMFAFALWDEKEKVLFCARDRFGEKPFYYSHVHENGVFLFASEMKALLAAGISNAVNDEALLLYIGLGYTEQPTKPSATFYKDISQLPPSHYLEYSMNDAELKISKYWQLKPDAKKISEDDAIDQFSDLLLTSVKRRLRSDVPLGTSLSGGIDSSSIAALIKSQNSGSVLKSFSAVFPGFEKDETNLIKIVSGSLGLDSKFVTPTADEFVRDLDKLIYHHEGPVSSASVYAQYRVFQLAKEHSIKVLLDGQGADEILGGYTKYFHWYLQEIFREKGLKAFSEQRKMLAGNGASLEWGFNNYVSAFLPGVTRSVLERREIKRLTSNNDIDKDFLHHHYSKGIVAKPRVSELNDILVYNTIHSGLQELLKNADRNSMAHGREVRLPFLSHDLVEFVFSLPSEVKIKDGWTKWLLRKTMKNRLPKEIVWRKDKVGFEPPQESWMAQSPVDDLIHESKKILVKKKILSASVLAKKNQPHKAYAAENSDWRYLIAGQLLR